MARFVSELVRESPRVLTALGASVAAVGFVVYGMGLAYREPRDGDITIGIVLIVVGVGASLLGLGMTRAGFGGSDRFDVEPAQSSTPRRAVHPRSPEAPHQAARPTGDGGRPR